MNVLIDATGLAGQLQDPRLLLIDCRFDLVQPAWGREQYLAGHIPGALHADVNTDLSGPVTASTGRHPLPDPQTFAATLGRWGFTPEREVVCYDQGNGTFAARLWWLLRARGHEQVRVLDGGMAAWRAAGGAVSTLEPQVTATQVAARAFAGVLDTAAVEAGLAGNRIHLVDARAADRFAGRNETIDPVAGHVPGAVNHPFSANLDARGQLRAPQDLRAAWRTTLDGRAPGELVMMCGSGVTACHNLLALEAAGLPGARLYAGSYSEWIRDPARPVATEGEQNQ